jgi:regulator of CtrA degradation
LLTDPDSLWHEKPMHAPQYQLTPKLIDSLYVEAMVLADEARSYFDSDHARDIGPAEVAVAFSCESLKVTTRLMHVIAWLLNQKAIRAGEIHPADTMSRLDELGYAPATDDWMVCRMPQEARTLILASEDLYYRVQRIGSHMGSEPDEVPEPHRMIDQLRQAF